MRTGLEKLIPGQDTAGILDGIEKNYRLLVEEAPRMGGTVNPLSLLHYFSAYLIAVYQETQAFLNDDAFSELCLFVLTHNKKLAKELGKVVPADRKTQRKIKDYAAWASARRGKYSQCVQLRFDDNDDSRLEFTVTRCVLVEMCRFADVPELARLICELEIQATKNFGFNLNRTGCLATDDGDCHFVLANN